MLFRSSDRLGLPTPVAVASVTALIINIGVNLLLIPAWGIVGASAASLVSYSVHAAILVAISSRMARRTAAAFVIPGRDEVRRLRDGLGRLLTSMRPAATR